RAADQQVADEFAAAIRVGDAPQYANGHDFHTLEHAVEMGEAAQRQFDRELADANGKLGSALDVVRRAAADVLAAIVEREAEQWRRDVREIRRRYFRLNAATILWPDDTGPLRLAHVTSELLVNPPDFSESPSDQMSATN